MTYLAIIFSSIFLSNVLLTNFVGLPTFVEKDSSIKKPLVLALRSLVVALISSLLLYPIYTILLKPENFEFLYIIIALLVVAVVDMLVNKLSKFLKIETEESKMFDVLVPSNAFIIVLALLVISNATFLNMIMHVLGLGLGYLVILIMIHTIKTKVDLPGGPKAFKGLPLILITLGLIAMIFMGLAGIL